MLKVSSALAGGGSGRDDPLRLPVTA